MVMCGTAYEERIGHLLGTLSLNHINKLDGYLKAIEKSAKVQKDRSLIEILLMYDWSHDMEGDNDYWQEYLEMVLPALKNCETRCSEALLRSGV